MRFGVPPAVLGLTGTGSQRARHTKAQDPHHQNCTRGAKENSFPAFPGPELSDRSASTQEQKLVAQFRGIAMTTGRVAGSEAKNDLLKLPLDGVSGLDPLGRGRRVVGQTSACGDLIQDHSQAVEIGRWESGPLRCDVTGGAHAAGSLSRLAHQPHIGQTGPATQVDDVRGLDIPMNQTCGVEHLQSIGHSQAHFDTLSNWKAAPGDEVDTQRSRLIGTRALSRGLRQIVGCNDRRRGNRIGQLHHRIEEIRSCITTHLKNGDQVRTGPRNGFVASNALELPIEGLVALKGRTSDHLNGAGCPQNRSPKPNIPVGTRADHLD